MSRAPGRPASAAVRPSEPIPDRTLDVPTDPPTIAVRAAGHHPFLYKKMVIGAVGGPRPAPGDLVRVVDRDGVPLGFGLWNGRSQIAVRLIAAGTSPPGEEFWRRKIHEAISLRRDTLGLDAQTDAYRLIHAEGDGLSGLVVDRFADVLSAEVFSVGIYQRIGPLMALIAAEVGSKHFRVHVDDRISLAEDFPGRPLASPEAPGRVEVREHGIRFRVHFEGGHKTGFFCDQRENRLDLARYCRDRLVLDVCCYSGGFALNALIRGAAREVTGVDLDEKAIAAARINANLNQVRPGLVHADAFGYMRQMAANGRSYGVVALDPPKLIANRDEIGLGKRKYFDLNVLAMGLVEPGGLLLTCSCSGLLPLDEFLSLLRAAARQAGRSARILAITGAAADHPVGLDAPEGAYLKAAWLWMGDRRPTIEAAGPGDQARG